ncbi:MAG: hypothetical protein GVY10_07655 [Verrucomicrobia bacterium]|jgi:LPS sulfotransferase NodH|nr:hypothetical protein [Verrucomicrobiota bacterium]
MPRDLFIAATPRSGSELLCQWFLRSYLYGWTGEWFAFGTVEGDAAHLGVPGETRLGPLLEALRREKAADDGRVSLKMMWPVFAAFRGQEGASPLSFLRDPECVWVRRRDKVAQAVSLYKAEKTDKWRSEAGDQEDVPYSGADIARCLQRIRAEEAAWEAFFAEEELEPRLVTYEDFAPHQREAFRALLETLDLPPVPEDRIQAPPTIRKQGTANNEALRKRFRAENGSLA